MPGPPPRQHKHERQYTPNTHSFIPTRRIWNDEDDGQMIFGDLGGLKFSDICLTGEEKPRKKPHPGNLSRPGIEPGAAAWQARTLPLAPQRWAYIYIYIYIGLYTYKWSLFKNIFLLFIFCGKINYDWHKIISACKTPNQNCWEKIYVIWTNAFLRKGTFYIWKHD